MWSFVIIYEIVLWKMVLVFKSVFKVMFERSNFLLFWYFYGEIGMLMVELII